MQAELNLFRRYDSFVYINLKAKALNDLTCVVRVSAYYLRPTTTYELSEQVSKWASTSSTSFTAVYQLNEIQIVFARAASTPTPIFFPFLLGVAHDMAGCLHAIWISLVGKIFQYVCNASIRQMIWLGFLSFFLAREENTWIVRIPNKCVAVRAYYMYVYTNEICVR